MKKLLKPIHVSLMSCALASGTLYSSIAAASIDIADTPLFMGIQADPNLMFIMDDSGSMHWEYMPQSRDVSGRAYSETYLFPQPRYVYGTSDYAFSWKCPGNYYYDVPVHDSNNIYHQRLRNSAYNKLYYNPDITYEPWYNADGTQMPDMDPANALYNPARPGLGDLDLTSKSSMPAHWFSGTSLDSQPYYYNCSEIGSYSFWPMTYYAADTVNGGYKEIVIGPSPVARSYTSPGGITRDLADEQTNFANWFSYYRSRALASRAGIGAAFSTQGDGMRVGYAAINKGGSTVDGVSSTNTVVSGVRTFSGSGRDDFYDQLYNRDSNAGGTPLRSALDDVGQYFTRTDNAGPWGASPGTSDASDHVQCRKSFSILMTDGYWTNNSGDAAATTNANDDNDTDNGATHANPDSTNYLQRLGGGNYTGYVRRDPFDDSRSKTLADVAMYYWKNDLRSDLPNKVRVKEQGDGVQDISNPAYWQHMVTFGVGLGVTGNQVVDTVYDAVKNGTDITWDDPFASNDAKIDDLLHAAINSRGGFFSAGNPGEFSTKLKGVLDEISADEASSSSAVANTTRLDTDTLVYQAKFNPNNWSGQLLAYTVDKEGDVDTDDPEWEADDELPAPASRNILTFIPGSGGSAGGKDFLWSNLSRDQQNYLHNDIYGVADGYGEERLAYLRGDVTVTGPSSDPFRNRISADDDDKDGYDILGDIIHSDPIFVGTGDFGYGRETSGLTDTEKNAYNKFRNQNSYLDRDGMIYINANDGMFHGFNAKTGKEEFAFIPNQLFPKLSALTSTDYSHQYYMDATPHMGDAYIGSSWTTMVTSTLGAGGRGLFAIDVTDPDSVGGNDIMWEVEANDADANLRHLGYVLGKPQIVRTQSGDWVVLVGNGYNSADHQAVLFVLDAADGSVITTINTGVGDATNPNGLATPLAVDLDGDRILDSVYAGDLQGNMWKFDFSSKSTSKWGVAIGGRTPAPLYQACDGSCSASTWQPITTQPVVASHDQGIMILFGTGKYFSSSDAIVGSSPRTEAVYGIFDCGSETNSKLCGSTVTQRELIQQEILVENDNGTSDLNDDYRVGSNNDVEVTSSTKGWYMELKPPGASHGSGERVVANPVLVNDAVLFITFTPDANPCNFGGSSWLMEMPPTTGGRFSVPKLDLNGDGVIDDKDVTSDPKDPSGDPVPITGTRQGGKRSSPGILHGGGADGKQVFKIFSSSNGSINIELNKGVNKAGRQSWRQLR